MTIADNLAALANQKLGYQDSVEDCKTSLINKDVAVPVSTKLADIAGLIDEITVDKSWENLVSVRNGTKTTVVYGDIDTSNLTGVYSASYFIHGSNLISGEFDFSNLQGTRCLQYAFGLCSNLSRLRLNLASFNGGFAATNATTGTILNEFILDGMSDTSLWGSTSPNINIFSQIPTCQNITITCPILPNLYLGANTDINFTSVLQILSKLYDYSNGVAHTITFNRSFMGLSLSDYNLINNAKIEANARNWTVAGLTYSM